MGGCKDLRTWVQRAKEAVPGRQLQRDKGLNESLLCLTAEGWARRAEGLGPGESTELKRSGRVIGYREGFRELRRWGQVTNFRELRGWSQVSPES